MKPAAVIVDVAIDQGGLHRDQPADDASRADLLVDGVVHYCVTNMPGAVGRTSTYALCNVTLPYVLQTRPTWAGGAWRRPIRAWPRASTSPGRVTNLAVA